MEVKKNDTFPFRNLWTTRNLDVRVGSFHERKKEMAKQAYSFCFISEAYLQKKKQESFAWKLKKERHFNE